MNTTEDKVQLLLQHPDESPEITGTLPYLLEPPRRLSSTSRWLRFREETLLPLIAERPDDPHLSHFLQQAEAVLAWRAAVPPDRRFWKAD